MNVNVCTCLSQIHTETSREWNLTALFLTKQRNIQEREDNSSEEGWQGCNICMEKAPNKSCGSYSREQPQAGNNFHPIISAVSHPRPDVHTGC